MTTTILPASDLARAELAALWTEAFSDYYAPGTVTAETLETFERAFDLDFSGSRVVAEDGRPVAFGMLGVRERRGWVGGMGVVPGARRRGHGMAVMRGLIDASRERGLQVLRLEVLVQNVQAIPLYESLGFRSLRKLEVWDRAADVPAPAMPSPSAHEIPVDDAAARIATLRPERPPWQRELEGVRRGFPDIEALASADGRAVAIFRATPERIGIVELASEPDRTRGVPGERGDHGAGDAAAQAALDQLLATLFAAYPSRSARLLNLPEGDLVAPALSRVGAAVSHRQWEMELGL